jgi:ribonuclease P protein component
VSAEKGFPKHKRLRTTDEFSSVFAFRRTVRGELFHVLMRPNRLTHPRLGVIVAKKVARAATARNYMKRTVREFFRLHQAELEGMDVVVRVSKPFTRSMHAKACKELARHFSGLRNVSSDHSSHSRLSIADQPANRGKLPL